ncbi:hypothetical protein DRP04_14580, partial [Archaeoglobales archaeon]
LLQLEFDIRYINAVSRKVLEEHALVRLIISALATPDELQNLVKRDFRVMNRNGETIYTVKLTSAGRSRIAPIDERTYEIVMDICKNKGSRQRVFNYTKDEIDKIVEKYSPANRKYNALKLREAVKEILRDCMFFDHDYVSDLLNGVNLDGVIDFLYDSHPMFSGMWDLDDDEVAEDFIMNYMTMTGIRDAKKIAEVIGESEERVARLMRREFRRFL